MSSSYGSLLKTSGFSRPSDSRSARSRSVLIFRHESPASRSYVEDYWCAEVVAGEPTPEPWASMDWKPARTWSGAFMMTGSRASTTVAPNTDR
jgi:hypothetical protein